MTRKLTAITVPAVVAAGLLAIGIGPASAEAFHSSYMTKTFTPRATPYQEQPGNWPINAGQTVNMRCWTTGPTVDGTGKWFKVDKVAYPYTSGYVPANDVGNQWLSSPHC